MYRFSELDKNIDDTRFFECMAGNVGRKWMMMWDGSDGSVGTSSDVGEVKSGEHRDVTEIGMKKKGGEETLEEMGEVAIMGDSCYSALSYNRTFST